MLRALGVDRLDLLSNNPDKADQLEAYGIDVMRRTATGVHLSTANQRYLQAKVMTTAHTLALPLQLPRAV